MRSPTTLLTDAWSHVKDNFQLFASIYAIPAVLTIFFVLTFGEEPNLETISPSFVGLFFLFILVLFVVNILAGIAMIRAVSQPQVTTFQNAYAYGKKMFWPYLWVGILTGLAVMIGFMLLIIPGIIFLVWFLFGYMEVLIDDRRGTDALKSSKELVQGQWWGVFGRFLFMMLVTVLISIAFGIAAAVFGGMAGDRAGSVITALANFVIVPLSLTYVYFMYQDLKGAQISDGDDGATSTPSTAATASMPHAGDREPRSETPTATQPETEANDTSSEPEPEERDINDGVEENKKQGY